ncbi:hypothetical protein [Actinoplanes sp. URMC 104]|uniref:hypothetical protein n=1 Tax=Actinoplanes sp. URMC 104 TaxID=3423409 RepID=UPI003F1B3F05
MTANTNPPISATLHAAHTRPVLHVTVGGATVELPIDLHGVIARNRTHRPLVEAVAVEGAKQMRRSLGYAPAGAWRRDRKTGGFTVPVAEIPGRCETCVSGCACTKGSDGCEHLGCWGRGAYVKRNSCPGAALMTAPARQLRAKADR